MLYKIYVKVHYANMGKALIPIQYMSKCAWDTANQLV